MKRSAEVELIKEEGQGLVEDQTATAARSRGFNAGIRTEWALSPGIGLEMKRAYSR